MRLLEGQIAFKDLVSRVLTFDYIGALVASLVGMVVVRRLRHRPLREQTLAVAREMNGAREEGIVDRERAGTGSELVEVERGDAGGQHLGRRQQGVREEQERRHRGPPSCRFQDGGRPESAKGPGGVIAWVLQEAG